MRGSGRAREAKSKKIKEESAGKKCAVDESSTEFMRLRVNCSLAPHHKLNALPRHIDLGFVSLCNAIKVPRAWKCAITEDVLQDLVAWFCSPCFTT